MPPPEAITGTYVDPGGKKIKVAPLSDEDRLTLVRWIDLGCPIDLDYDATNPQTVFFGGVAERCALPLDRQKLHGSGEEEQNRGTDRGLAAA